jgi:thiamine pyrophosphokinase
MMNVGNRVSCRELFIKLNICPLHTKYILLLLLLAVKSVDVFKSNIMVHSIKTSHTSDLFPPTTELTKYHRQIYYSDINIFNHVPQSIKNLSWNVKNFKWALKLFFCLVNFIHLMNIWTGNLWVNLVLCISLQNWYIILHT